MQTCVELKNKYSLRQGMGTQLRFARLQGHMRRAAATAIVGTLPFADTPARYLQSFFVSFTFLFCIF